MSEEKKLQSEIFLYTTPEGKVKVETILFEESLWLSQKRMADLFGVQVPAIAKHIANIFEDEELTTSTLSKMEIVRKEGKREVKRNIDFYNLDMIIAVGYRVNSRQATQFRIWATQTLREFIIKGFVLDDERMKNGRHFGKDYLQELLERIRSIRSSERRIYQKITDIFRECCEFYDPHSEITHQFYANIQNKFHYAITGQTAAEIVYDRVDSQEEKVGMRTYKNAPKGRVLKSDVIVAKNYLNEKEIKSLERTVSSYFDYIENQIERGKLFSTEQFSYSVDRFLSFNDYEILEGFGKITRAEANEKARAEYDIFNKTQKIDSDFDKFSKAILKKGKK